MIKIIVHLFRYFVGVLFIFSGLIKLNDPIGFSFKLEEYFGPTVFNLDLLIPIVLPMAIFIVILEVVLGIFLIIGFKKKFTLWSLLLMLGMHGNYAPNILTNECDVLIAIGMRFDDRVTGDVNRYAKQAKIIHFEIDPAEVNKNIEVDVAVLGDAKQTLNEILKITENKSHKKWHAKFKELYEIEYKKVIHDDLNPKKEGLTMGEVMKEINIQTKGDAAIVSDVGQHQMIACRYSNFNKTKSNITSGGLGTMGFALPAAIGAKMA